MSFNLWTLLSRLPFPSSFFSPFFSSFFAASADWKKETKNREAYQYKLERPEILEAPFKGKPVARKHFFFGGSYSKCWHVPQEFATTWERLFFSSGGTFHGVALECLGILIITNCLACCIESNNSVTCFPFFIDCLEEVKKPHCFHNIPHHELYQR